LRPGFADALNNLGLIHELLMCPQDAALCYQQAIAANPQLASAHSNLGNALVKLGRTQDAILCYQNALTLQPGFAHAHYNLGNALAGLGHLDLAISCYRNAISLDPRYADAHFNLGNTLARLGQLDEAAESLRRAIACRPDFAEAHFNLGNTVADPGQLAEAAASLRQAVAHRPGFAEAHNNLAMTLLALGDYAQGWQEYEWRWHMPSMIGGRRAFERPQWRGEPAAGKTLLLHAEQGFGDTLQFCRYATLAANQGLRVIMEVQEPLLRLMRKVAGVERVLARGEALPDFDFHCPMVSMPLALGTRLETIPSAPSYLQADPAQVAAWRARLGPASGLRVGLVWAGSGRAEWAELAAIDRRRSLDPALLAPLFSVPGASFFSLQKGGTPAPAGFPLIDFMDEMTDFADTAALIETLDLVISVDTSVVHLAAALGKPVWVLERFDSCWRWLQGRRDSPWYPSVRLYRQKQPGDWAPVLGEVTEALHAAAGA